MAAIFLVLLALPLASPEARNMTQGSFAKARRPSEERNREQRNSTRDYLDKTQRRIDPLEIYRQIARDLYVEIKAHRERQVPVVGQNDFEILLSKELKAKHVDLPHEIFERYRRQAPLLPHCGLQANDFEHGTKQPNWLGHPWEKVNHTMKALKNLASSMSTINLGRPSTPMPPEEHFTNEKLRNFNIVSSNLSLDNTKNVTLVAQNPTTFIATHSSQRKTGCGCSVSFTNSECSCCLYWKATHIIICAGCGFVYPTLKFPVFKFTGRITVQDFTLYQWEKELRYTDLDRKLALLSKSLCFPYEFAEIVTACLQLTIRLDPSFDAKVPSKLEICPGIIGRVVMVYDFMLWELPCWGLNFDFHILREVAAMSHGPMFYENGNMALLSPLKSLFTTENIFAIQTIVREMGEMDKKEDMEFERIHRDEKTIENIGERRKVVRKGTPTTAINWEHHAANSSLLRNVVVLYIHPYPHPINRKDIEELRALPDMRNMLLVALAQRHKKIPDLNVKVKPTLGQSCGGYIITRRNILTLCPCIKFFYLFHKYQKKPEPEHYKDPFTLVSADIYVTYAELHFNADQTLYELDPDPDLFKKNSKCFEAIEESIKRKADLDSINLLHAHFAIMSVTRDFVGIDPPFVMSWVRAKAVSHYTRGIPLEMIATGMKKTKHMDIYGKDGYELDPLYEMVDVKMVECEHETIYCRKGVSPPRHNVTFDDMTVPIGVRASTRCICAEDRGFQLCDGVVGFPLIYTRESASYTPSGVLLGLNAIPMQCRGDGSMLFTFFSDQFVNELEDVLKADTKKRRDAESTFPPPIPKYDPTLKPRSRASSNLAAYLPVPFILSVIAQ